MVETKWSGASEAEVNGQSSLIKRYDGAHSPTFKNMYHPSLPQMIGFSAEGTPTPFVLLSKGYFFVFDAHR